jgi:hypothetical protein
MYFRLRSEEWLSRPDEAGFSKITFRCVEIRRRCPAGLALEN